MKREVFICYTEADREMALAACEALEQERISCWIAERDAPAGLTISEEISRALDDSLLVVVVFSASTNLSIYAAAEIQRAFERGLPLVTFMVERAEIGARLSLFLRSHKMLTFREETREGSLARLVQAAQVTLRAQRERTARRVSRHVTCSAVLIMDARMAAIIIKRISHFHAEVSLEHGGVRISPKSAMGMLTLDDLRGATVLVTGEGVDAEAAVEALERLLSDPPSAP